MERETLFTAYADNLAAYLKASGLGLFDGETSSPLTRATCCPFCFRLHTSVYATNTAPELTVEHNPPESVGGFPVLLTCRPCNSGNGSAADHLIKRALTERAFVQKEHGSLIPARVRIGSSTAPAYIKRNEDGAIHISLAGTVHPYVRSVANDHFKQRGGQLGLTVGLVKMSSLNRALFKVAHLEAFRHFGHSYILHPNSKSIVASFSEKEPELPSYGRLSGVPSDAADGLYGALVDREMICFTVIFTIKYLEQWEKVAFVLPGYGKDGYAEYMRYKAMAPRKGVLLKPLQGSALPFGNVTGMRYREAWSDVTRTLWDGVD